jgi:FMN-dependent NADH-azoreductase
MSALLYVTSSLFGSNSQSGRIAGEFLEAWRCAHPGVRVIERNLDATSTPHLSLESLVAASTPAEQRSPAQREAAAYADALIEEAEAADVIVIAAPMYNFTIPSTLKAWIDHIARAGRTFRYGEAGPEGMLKGKKVLVVTARGGIYSEGPGKAMDFQEPYLRGMLGFIGLDDVTFIHVEGLKVGPQEAEKGIARARTAIREIAPVAIAA